MTSRGSFLDVIPLSGALHEKAGGWPTSARSGAKLKRAAEEAAKRDTIERAAPRSAMTRPMPPTPT
ncbi:MAG: hypothetical protein QXV79_03105 [Thermofilaceae archaeon]